MKIFQWVGIAVLAFGMGGTAASAQQGPPPASQAPPTITAVLNTELTIVEREVVGVAQEMPEDKYSFAPTNGEFKGVRTFAQQVKHLATVNDRVFDSILGLTAPVAPDEGITSNGPDAIQTKEQILQYLKESFARGHKAIATINAENALTPIKGAAVPFLSTRAALAIFDCAHAMDHYGQMVEYLRDNGHIPPASQQRPPANPQAKP
ncbi:MAG TPA: DinB family protein [Candidatus Acidoferrales bacterium]|nr:DinB family protein [Candidatus Acidoferrales bacterium]